MALEHRNLKNNWSTTLQAAAAAADTTLSLPQPAIDRLTNPNPSSSEWYELTLDDGVQAPEIVRCTAKGTGTVTVVRAQQGTVAPTTWAAGTKVEIRATAELLAILGCAQVDAINYVVAIGPGAAAALTDGYDNTVFGGDALYQETTGHGNTACGVGALGVYGGSSENTAFGRLAGSDAGTVHRCTYLGALADGAAPDLSDVLCLGYGAKAYTANTAVMGSEDSRLSEVYIGGGQRDPAAAQVTLSASAGNGTNKAGGTLRLAGGKPTGSGTPGKVVIATAAAGGASGSTETAWTDRAEWDSAGLFWTYAGLKTGDPGLGAGTWKLGTVQSGAVTLDTANYVEVDIGGTVVKLLKAA